MSKKKVKEQHSHISPKVPAKNKKTITKWLTEVLGIKSILLVVVGYFILHICVSNNAGYNWAWNDLMKGNWELTKKYPNLSIEERNQMKLGFNYSFLDYINKNTPEDAIVLFPLKENIQEQVGDYKLSSDIAVKTWVTHFIYPRKVVYKDEALTNPRYKQVTHVAIIAGHGYEDLDYSVTERTYFTVLPKKLLNK